MAKPARQTDPYEDDTSGRPITRPNLRILEGGNEGGAGPEGYSRPQAAPGGGQSLYNPYDEGPSEEGGGADSASGLRASEAGAGAGAGFATSGFGSNSDSDKRAQRRARAVKAGKFAFKHKSKIGLISGVGSGGIVSLFIVFFSLIPLKIEHIVNNLQSRFFSSSENAVSSETTNLFLGYVVQHVLPQYKGCASGSTLDRSCRLRATAFGNGPIGNLYTSWSQDRLENKLAVNYGIEFRYNKAENTWYLRGPGTLPGGANIGTDGDRLDTVWRQARQAEVRSVASTGLQNETSWKKVFYRYKVGRLLSEKYGIRRCLIFCGITDPIDDKIGAQKQAAKIYLADRVITPRDKVLGVAITCFLDPDCAPEDEQPTTTTEGTNGALNGEEASTFETSAQTTLESLAATFSAEDSTKLLKTYGDLSDRGFSKFLTDKLFSQIFEDATARDISDKLPVVGWVNMVAQAINKANAAGPDLKKLSYATNSVAAVSLFSMYRTYADEIHTGHVTATEVGSMTSSLGSGDTGSPNDQPEAGGTATAEQTPLYNAYINNSNPGNSSLSSSTALLDGFSSPKAYAATTPEGTTSQSGTYTCANGKPVPRGKLVCSEEVLGQGSAIANGIHDFLNNTPGLSVVTWAAGKWQATIGSVFTFVNGLIGTAGTFVAGVATDAVDDGCDTLGTGVNLTDAFLPQYCEIRDSIKAVTPKIAQWLMNEVIPNPFSSNMSGGRTFDMMAAGADVSGNDYAHTGLGAQAVSPAVSASIINQQQDEAQQEFARQPFFARMFSTDSQYSLVSRVAMDIPISFQSTAASSFASLVSNPFGELSRGFASIFSTKVSAATPAQPDPFKVTQYAYPPGSINSDPRKYWDQHCSDNASQGYQNDYDFQHYGWNAAAANGPTDINTGEPVNTHTNQCLLIKATVGSAGGIFDSSLLTKDDLAEEDPSGGAGSPAPMPGSGTLPTGSSKDLATQLLPFISSGKIVCGTAAGGSSGAANCLDIQNTAKGIPIGGSCAVDSLTPHLLGLILGLVQSDGWTLGISAICSNHSPEGDGPYAGHSYGSAADFSIQNGATGLAAATDQKFVDDAAALLSATGGSFGQVAFDAGSAVPVDTGNDACHAAYASQQNSKFTLFKDTCNHQHIRAAP